MTGIEMNIEILESEDLVEEKIIWMQEVHLIECRNGREPCWWTREAPVQRGAIR